MKTKNSKKKTTNNRTHRDQPSVAASLSAKKHNFQINMVTRQSSHDRHPKKNKPQSTSKAITRPKEKRSSLNLKKQPNSSSAKTNIRPCIKNSNPEEKTSSKSKMSRQKKLKAYFKAKVENLSQTIALDTTKSFFPLSHEPQQANSYCVYQENEVTNGNRECHLFDSQEEVASQMLDINRVRNDRGIVFNEKREKNRSSEVQSFGIFSKGNWEAFETLKLKNEELNNVIEQLVKVQEKLRAENEELHNKIGNQKDHEKKVLKDRIAELTLDRTQLTQTNVNLQELLNQSKQESDLTRNKCLQLQQTKKVIMQREQQLLTERDQHLNKIKQLSYQLRDSRRKAEELAHQNEQMEGHLKQCKEQKQKIRRNAVDLLQILRQLKQQQN